MRLELVFATQTSRHKHTRISMEADSVESGRLKRPSARKPIAFRTPDAEASVPWSPVRKLGASAFKGPRKSDYFGLATNF